MKSRKLLTLLLAFTVTAVNTATLVESSRSLHGGDLSVSISLPVAGKGKANLIALKCSVLGKLGVTTSFCASKGPSAPATAKAVAAGLSLVPGFPIYFTTDGTSWSPAGNSSSTNYTRVAISKDGATLLATYADDFTASTIQGRLLLSTDGGSSWSNVPDVTLDYGATAAGLGLFLQPLAASKNGSVMVVGTPNSQLWLSRDRGVSFVEITDRVAAADVEPVTPPPAMIAAAGQKAKPLTVKVLAPPTTLQARVQQMLQNPANKPGTKTSGAKTPAAAHAASLLFNVNNNHANVQPADVPAYQFTGAAISDDGQTIVVTPAFKPIFVSRDGGATFAAAAVVTKPWTGVAISSSGQYISAIILGNEVYSSSDYGVTWTPASVPLAIWTSITSDNSGQKLAASSFQLGTVSNSTIYTSTDAGASWQLASAGVLPSNKWSFLSVASNGDGSKLLAAAVLDTGNITAAEGALYASANAGGSWAKVDVPKENFWFTVAAAEGY